MGLNAKFTLSSELWAYSRRAKGNENLNPNEHLSTDSAFSNTSYMASTLRDGCDMDSMDRSLLDYGDLYGDQLASSHPLDSKPFLSLDPGKLVGLGSEAEGSSIRSSSRNLPDGGSCVPGKAEEAVAEICSDSADSPGRSETGTRRRETVVRFEAGEPIISTSLVEAGTKMEANLGGASSKGEH